MFRSRVACFVSPLHQKRPLSQLQKLRSLGVSRRYPRFCEFHEVCVSRLDLFVSCPELYYFRFSSYRGNQAHWEACRYVHGSSTSEESYAELHLGG